MIFVNANRLAASVKALKEKRKKISDTADGRFRQKLYYILELAAKVSPQFSGDFASNWHIVVSGNVPSYKRWGQKAGLDRQGKMLSVAMSQNVHQAGDPAAVSYVLQRGAAALRGVTRASQVHLVNASELTTDGTHMIGPDGVETLRPVNVIPGSVRIESYIRARAKEVKGI